ncbi:MAG TPA: transketolase [Elusimicrobia bacterium]|nr:MAG: transketolase [Elusimicrobia bacterium GWA2_66_18]OGR75993.1 MAG: transketolase [Elusimicrobia bacterium GWC2_65_9]HAZ08386.1 transketolase [Elusimicrobiota bacterium]
MPIATADLKALARDMRVDVIRMIEAAGSGHPGGSLSVIDLLAVLYWKFLKHDPKNPDWPDRDRLILSKGHACPALYTVMAYRGYFPKERLMTLRKLGSPLQGHPDRLRLPGIEFSSGSLGQGLSVGLGMTISAKMDKAPWKTYVVLGDGELQEGQCWEALMAAPKFKLDNLVAIVDHNNGQIDGPVDWVMGIEPLEDKLRSFNWDVRSVDGHDLAAIEDAFARTQECADKPHAIVAKTIKGKGVSFMENDIAWHGSAPKKDDADKAVEDIRHG